MTGWTEQEGAAKPSLEVFNIVSADTRQPVEDFVRRAVRGGSEVERRNQALLVARDDLERWTTVSSTPIDGARGEICGAVLVFRDQTREQALLKSLGESLAENQNLFRSMLSGCAVHDILLNELGCPVDYRFISVNPAFER